MGLKKVRSTLDALAEEASIECAKFSEDVKFWAEFQTGVKVFEPWLKNAEARKQEGLKKPVSLVEACEILGDSKNLQDNAEAKLKVLEDAAASAQKMTSHQEADIKVAAFKERWTVVHECFKEWVARMTTLVECWNKLDGMLENLAHGWQRRIPQHQKVEVRSLSKSLKPSSTHLKPCSLRSRNLFLIWKLMVLLEELLLHLQPLQQKQRLLPQVKMLPHQHLQRKHPHHNERSKTTSVHKAVISIYTCLLL